MTQTTIDARVTVDGLLALGRETLAEINAYEARFGSNRCAHLIEVAQMYNRLAALLSRYPEAVQAIADVAVVLGQARHTEPLLGGTEVLRTASTMSDSAFAS